MTYFFILFHRPACPAVISGAQRKAKKKQILCDLCVLAVIINYPIIIRYRIYEYVYLATDDGQRTTDTQLSVYAQLGYYLLNKIVLRFYTVRYSLYQC
jgi:hypothetical protein